MLERELKFHVPARQRAGLKSRLRKLDAEEIDLHARYYDTEAQALARARIALRLRREGAVWVQTVKTPGPDELSRIEWNHPRPEPTLDLSIYADTHIGTLMADIGSRLRCRYITQITRLRKIAPTTSGTVELAYDEGIIMAGDIRLPVHELEIESISGDSADFFALARTWLAEHRLILELRSKAARGDTIASLNQDSALDIRSAWSPESITTSAQSARHAQLKPRHVQRLAAPVRANQPRLPADIGIRAAYLECANECMSQIIHNSGFLAGLDSMKTTPEQRIEYVHQIRVGIRRLRTCWKLFTTAADQPADLTERLKQYFRQMGQTRDQDVIQTELLPRLLQAGMPPDTVQAEIGAVEAPGERVNLAGSPAYQQTLLDLLEHLVQYGDDMASTGPGKRAAPILSKRLNAWLNDIRRSAPLFMEAAWEDRHTIRKRVKRLRYGMEFAQGTLDPARLAPLRNALVSAQKALGHLNDLYVAAEYYRGPGAKHPSAMFALGWLAATQEHEAKASFVALQELSKADRFHPTAGKKKRKPA